MHKIPALAALCTVVFGACGGSADAPPVPTAVAPQITDIVVQPTEPIIIGLSAALSGDQRDLGSDLVAGAILSAGQFNLTVKGHAIELVPRDDGCTDPEKAADVAAAFIAEEALAGLVGPMCTNGAQAANPRYEARGIIHISSSATRVDLSEQGERFFFRTVWRDDAQAGVQATYARTELNASTAIVVGDGEPYGNALADEFAARFEAGGGRVLSEPRIQRGTTDFSTLARQVADAVPDVVVFEGFNPEGALFVRELGVAGYGGNFIGPDGLLSARDFLLTAGETAEGAIITGGTTPTPGFVETYVALYGRAPATPFVLQAHDAVTALIRAIDTAAIVDGAGTLRIDREQLAETMREQRFAGLTGSITFDEKGDRRGATPGELGVAVYRVERGVFVPVE